MIRPTWRFLISHPAHFFALGFGSGLSPVAPGTVGSLLAVVLFRLGQPWSAAPYVPLVLAALFVIGTWFCAVTGRGLGVTDHGAMVWDEMVAMWLVLFFTPPTLLWQAFAFLLFRIFDIAKPPPIRYFDATLKTGFGVMFDDLIAAAYVLAVVLIGQLFVGGVRP
jgi:phosphatidylglycerophosphatase A